MPMPMPMPMPMHTCRDNQFLLQQVRSIDQGALGTSAAHVIRQLAIKNGLAQFAPTIAPATSADTIPSSTSSSTANCNPHHGLEVVTAMESQDHYRTAFDHAPVGMAIASLGGSFVDCNQVFCQWSGYTKAQVLGKTIFTMTARQDLHYAFAQLSAWLQQPSNNYYNNKPTLVVRGNLPTTTMENGTTAVAGGQDTDASGAEDGWTLRVTPVESNNHNTAKDNSSNRQFQFLCITLVPPLSQQQQEGGFAFASSSLIARPTVVPMDEESALSILSHRNSTGVLQNSNNSSPRTMLDSGIPILSSNDSKPTTDFSNSNNLQRFFMVG
jgi:hypothetical protein